MYFVDAQDTRRYEMICGPQFLALFLKQPLYRRDRDIIPPCDLSKGHVAKYVPLDALNHSPGHLSTDRCVFFTHSLPTILAAI